MIFKKDDQNTRCFIANGWLGNKLYSLVVPQLSGHHLEAR